MEKWDIAQVFERNIEAARHKAGLTKQQLAKRAGVSQSTVSEAIRGVTSPSLDTANNLAHALGVQLWELLVDTPATRRAAIERMLAAEQPGGPVPASAPPRRRNKK